MIDDWPLHPAADIKTTLSVGACWHGQHHHHHHPSTAIHHDYISRGRAWYAPSAAWISCRTEHLTRFPSSPSLSWIFSLPCNDVDENDHHGKLPRWHGNHEHCPGKREHSEVLRCLVQCSESLQVMMLSLIMMIWYNVHDELVLIAMRKTKIFIMMIMLKDYNDTKLT